MAKRKLGEAGQRGYPKVGLRRLSATELARTFSRRRNAVLAQPSSAPKKPSHSSNEQSSSSGESSASETIDDATIDDAVYRSGFNTDLDNVPEYILDEGDAGDENSSGRFKITIKPLSEIYLKSLVQDKEPLLNLEQDVTSHLVLNKIKELHEKYASFRRVRGDGNCFFRAFKFAYLEHILLKNDMGEANRILAKVEELKFRILLDHMAPSETLISDCDAFCNIVTLISSSSENRIGHPVLLQWSKDEDGYSDPAIRFLRMVTSNEICKRQNHFEQSIRGLMCDDAMTVQKFCEIEVERMDKDVDNVQIIAFVDALGVPIRIEYVHDSEYKLNHFDFGIESSPLEEPYITLLYRPGHYDILYTKEYHVLVPEPVEVVLKDSEIPKKEPSTIAKVPLTSEMDPSEKDEHMPMILHTYIRRKRKAMASRNKITEGITRQVTLSMKCFVIENMKELTKDYDGPTPLGCKDFQTEWTLPELIPQSGYGG